MVPAAGIEPVGTQIENLGRLANNLNAGKMVHAERLELPTPGV